jgi:hypothetical protein
MGGLFIRCKNLAALGSATEKMVYRFVDLTRPMTLEKFADHLAFAQGKLLALIDVLDLVEAKPPFIGCSFDCLIAPQAGCSVRFDAKHDTQMFPGLRWTATLGWSMGFPNSCQVLPIVFSEHSPRHRVRADLPSRLQIKQLGNHRSEFADFGRGDAHMRLRSPARPFLFGRACRRDTT